MMDLRAPHLTVLAPIVLSKMERWLMRLKDEGRELCGPMMSGEMKTGALQPLATTKLSSPGLTGRSSTPRLLG